MRDDDEDDKASARVGGGDGGGPTSATNANTAPPSLLLRLLNFLDSYDVYTTTVVVVIIVWFSLSLFVFLSLSLSLHASSSILDIFAQTGNKKGVVIKPQFQVLYNVYIVRSQMRLFVLCVPFFKLLVVCLLCLSLAFFASFVEL